MIEAVREAAAVDVEGGEDVEDKLHREMPVDGPEDDLQVFLARFQSVEDAVEQQLLVLEAPREQPEVAAVELDPERLALKMFQPAGSQITAPVLLDPLADRRFTEVLARLLALDPLVAIFFALAVLVDAALLHDGAL